MTNLNGDEMLTKIVKALKSTSASFNDNLPNLAIKARHKAIKTTNYDMLDTIVAAEAYTKSRGIKNPIIENNYINLLRDYLNA